MSLTVRSLNDQTWWILVTPEAKHHLLRSLSNLKEGAPTTPSFPLYGKSDWSVVTDFLSSISLSHDVPDWLLDYEYSREEKYGAQGGHAPWDELRDNALLYFERNSEVTNYSCDTAKYEKLGIRVLSNGSALQLLKAENKIQTRAAGWRAFNLKKTDIVAQYMALEDLRTSNWRNGFAYFFSRYNKKKKRLFIPMPFSNMIGQAKYFHPFLLAIQSDLRRNKDKSEFVFWSDKLGFDFCFHDVIEQKLKESHISSANIVYVMRDFEKMDTSTGVSQKTAYFLPKLAAALKFLPDSDSYNEMKDQILFSNICPIATPEGMWCGEHGEASGATVTNGGETCCNEEYNRIFEEKLAELCANGNILYDVIIAVGNGDDGMSIFNLHDVSKFDAFAKCIRKAAEYAASVTNFVIQAEKWDINLGTYGKYCQYLVDYNGSLLRAMYPAALILNSICNPETEYPSNVWDRDYVDLNVVMKLSNGRELPYFHELIDYVDKGMKYGLMGKSSRRFQTILSKYDKYRALQSSSQDYNWFDKEDKRGIMFNPVIQYLIQKRGISV